jgi:hypothetical protein
MSMVYKRTNYFNIDEGHGMLKRLMILGTCIILASVCFSGCDLLNTEPDHITVNVMVAVYVTVVDEYGTPLDINPDGVPMTILMTKNGGDQLVFQRVVQQGLCQATGVYELSTGQYIECNVTLQSGNTQYHQVNPGYMKLSWDTAVASKNYGNMYSWYPHITIHLTPGASF